MEERAFAFGGNVVEGCDCPAVAAGFHPARDQDVLEVATAYDSVIMAWNDNEQSSGIIDEQQAKSSWLGIIQMFECHRNHKQAEVAKEIAKELDWY